MDRLKSVSLTVIGFVIATAALGLFASVGLAVLGAMFTFGALVATAAGIAAFLAPKPAEGSQPAEAAT